MTEQRLHPRFAIELDVTLEAAQERVAGRTQDLSKGGLCMRASGGLPVGTDCIVRLALVFDEDSFSEQLELDGTVIWSTPIKTGRQLGIKFAPLTPEVRGYLDLFMRFLEGDEDGDDEG